MAKGKPDLRWREKVLDWKKSNKTLSDWCRENGVPVTTLIGWEKRFDQLNKKQTFEINKPFVELKNSPSQNSGIFLECKDVKIHLEPEFDVITLKRCLACLRGAVC